MVVSACAVLGCGQNQKLLDAQAALAHAESKLVELQRVQDSTTSSYQEALSKLSIAEQELIVQEQEIANAVSNQQSSANEVERLKDQVVEIRAALESAEESLSVFRLAEAARQQEIQERERASAESPDYIKTLGCQPEGDGFLVFIEVCSATGKAIPASGDLSVRMYIKGPGRPGPWQPEFLLYATSKSMTSLDYQEVSIGLGVHERRTVIACLPRIPWKEIKTTNTQLEWPSVYHKFARNLDDFSFIVEANFRKSGRTISLTTQIPSP